MVEKPNTVLSKHNPSTSKVFARRVGLLRGISGSHGVDVEAGDAT
jgi:hypothetical protein